MDQVPDNQPDDEVSMAEKVNVTINNSSEQKTEVKIAKEPVKANRFKGLKKKRWLIGATAGIVLVVLGTVGYLASNRTDEPAVSHTEQQPKMGLTVSLIDGTAKSSTDGQTWETLTTESTLSEGEYVSTDAASRVVLAFDDGSAVRLDESSTIILSSLDVNNIQINNEAGTVYSRVVTSERSFNVDVDGTTYTALGTAFNTINKDIIKGLQVMQSSVSAEGNDEKIDEGKQLYKTHSNAELKDKITDISVDELKSSGFMIWNLEQDKQSEAFKDKLGYLTKMEEQPAPAAVPAPAGASIKLTATTYDKGVTLKWTISGVTGHKGFKVVRSKKTTTPTYGKDEANYAEGVSTRSLNWKDYGGLTYHYRVCAYNGESCSTYSNVVTVASPYIPPEPVVSGTVTLGLSGTTASWTYTGTAPHGFKVLVNTSSGVSYADSYKAFASSSPYTINTSDLDPGTYYVGVCKRTGDGSNGGCMDYSNEETFVVN